MYNSLIKYFDYNPHIWKKYVMYSNDITLNSDTKGLIVPIDYYGNINGEFSFIYGDKTNKIRFKNPYTSESMKRTSNAKSAPHPFFDTTDIIFSNEDDNGVNRIFMENLKDFNEKFGTEETKLIERFYRNRESVEKLRTFVLSSDSTKKSYILFEAYGIDDKEIDDSELWKSNNILDGWKKYCDDKLRNTKPIYCTITGKTGFYFGLAPKINFLGSTMFTSNEKYRFVNSSIENKPVYCYDTQHKISSVIDYLVRDNINHSFEIDKNRIMIAFSGSANDELVKLICSQNNNNNSKNSEEFDDDFIWDWPAKDLIDSLKTSSYVKGSNNDIIHIITINVIGQTISIGNYFTINGKDMFDNLELWKNNFCYDVFNFNDGKYDVKRISINNFCKDFDINKSNVKRYLNNSMIMGIEIPNCVTNWLSVRLNKAYISIAGKKLDGNSIKKVIKPITSKILSVRKFNKQLKGNIMTTEEKRNELLGRIYESLYLLECRYNRENNIKMANYYTANQYTRFYSSPFAVIDMMLKIRSHVITYAKKNKYHQWSIYENYMKQYVECGYSKNIGVTDIPSFIYGCVSLENEETERFYKNNKKKEKDNLLTDDEKMI